MITNKVFIGDVYQIYKVEDDDFDLVKFNYERIKEDALLYKIGNETFVDLETNLVYKSAPNVTRQFGDVVVLTNELESFNAFIDESLRCTDIPKRRIKKIYKKLKQEDND